MLSETEIWIDKIIKQEEIDKYLENGRDFIDSERIIRQLAAGQMPQKEQIRDIIAKALDIERLEPAETAALLNVTEPELWEEIFTTAGRIKKKVYDNRIVTFAPLYLSNLCVNNCLYCGFRSENKQETRRILDQAEIAREVESLLATGHKRMILVCGEHPRSGADYIAASMQTIYSTRICSEKAERGIRRINVNAAPMPIFELKKIKAAGIGTYQVFQETYHPASYARLHPGTLKANYRWRLYALHRAMDAGIDDVAVGALFGLYDWRFEVMGLLAHAIDLEKHFGIGPHTVSFPRLNVASGSTLRQDSAYIVSDENLKKLVAVLRLAIPYSGMIITAREREEIRREIIPLGCTQTDASTKIAVGSYSETQGAAASQQFDLGDTRSLDDVIKEFLRKGIITSFCTAGYRCGRTGDKIMGMLKSGHEGKFCKLNAVLTFKEWLEDHGDAEARILGEKVLAREFEEIAADEFYRKTGLGNLVKEYYERIINGERDLYI